MRHPRQVFSPQTAILLLLTLLPIAVRCQEPVEAPDPAVADGRHGLPGGYERPSATDTLHDIISDSVGPYSITMALFTAGIHQGTNNPREWGQGMAGFGDRFGSNMGITLTGTAARYALANAMNVNTLYYRCDCNGVWPRFRHAMLSTLIARQRDDGSRVFSYPNLVAPYAATFTAVYGWYPSRYNAEDAFRMGNYNLLGTAGSNLVFEFMPLKAHEFLHKVHLSSSRLGNTSSAPSKR